MKWKFFMLALLGSLAVSAQFNGNKEQRTHGMLHIIEYQLPINGTPYVNEIFKKGTITIQNRDSKLVEDRLMRFNAFTGEMEYLGPDGKERTLLKRENITVELDGMAYEVHPYKEGREINRAYFIRLNDGDKAVVYKKPIKYFRKGAMPEHGYEDAREPEYFDASEYYLRMDGASMVPLAMNKKGLLSALHNHREDVKKYVSDRHLNLRDAADAMQVIAYYNRLVAVN